MMSFLIGASFFMLCSLVTYANFNLSDTAAAPLSVTYYGNKQLTALTDDINWMVLKQCSTSTGEKKNIQVSIIQPENPRFNSRKAFALVEISSCANSFADSCIIGVNYFKNGGQMQAYNNITIPYDSSISTLAIRYKSEVGSAPVSFHITYSDDEKFSGQYDSTVFDTPSVPHHDPTYFGQYVKIEQVETVLNYNYNYYYFSFCEDDIKIQSQYYRVDVVVTSYFSTPLAAFDLVACSKYAIPDYANDCTILNDNNNAIAISEKATSISSVSLDSADVDLGQGVWIGVYGYGGDQNEENSFLLYVEAIEYN